MSLSQRQFRCQIDRTTTFWCCVLSTEGLCSAVERADGKSLAVCHSYCEEIKWKSMNNRYQFLERCNIIGKADLRNLPLFLSQSFNPSHSLTKNSPFQSTRWCNAMTAVFWKNDPAINHAFTSPVSQTQTPKTPAVDICLETRNFFAKFIGTKLFGKLWP